jgi:hypothetical protein
MTIAFGNLAKYRHKHISKSKTMHNDNTPKQAVKLIAVTTDAICQLWELQQIQHHD